MSIKSLEAVTFEFPEQEPSLQDSIAEETVAVMGTARMVSHVDLRDRNDPLGHYGGLLDDAEGDVREASHMLMDAMINRTSL